MHALCSMSCVLYHVLYHVRTAAPKRMFRPRKQNAHGRGHPELDLGCFGKHLRKIVTCWERPERGA
jgi:hypothetical protein